MGWLHTPKFLGNGPHLKRARDKGENLGSDIELDRLVLTGPVWNPSIVNFDLPKHTPISVNSCHPQITLRPVLSPRLHRSSS